MHLTLLSKTIRYVAFLLNKSIFSGDCHLNDISNFMIWSPYLLFAAVTVII